MRQILSSLSAGLHKDPCPQMLPCSSGEIVENLVQQPAENPTRKPGDSGCQIKEGWQLLEVEGWEPVFAARQQPEKAEGSFMA